MTSLGSPSVAFLTISPNFVSFSPCHCWIDFSHSNQQLSEICFFGTRDTLLEAFFHHFFLCQGIQVTATTPSSTAVRLDTGVVSLEVSNSAPSSGLLPGQLRRSKYSVNLLNMNKFIYTWNIFIHKREVSEETVVLLRCIMRWFAFTMILIYNVNWPPGEKLLKGEW